MTEIDWVLLGLIVLNGEHATRPSQLGARCMDSGAFVTHGKPVGVHSAQGLALMVSRYLKHLEARSYVKRDFNGGITATALGREVLKLRSSGTS